MLIGDSSLTTDNKNLEIFYEYFQPGMLNKQTNLFPI